MTLLAHFFSPAQMPYEADERRIAQRRAMKLTERLQQREVFRFGCPQLHAEFYPANSPNLSPTLLFLTGLGTYCELYAELLAQLAARGFNVVAVDLRGHGYSEGVRGVYTLRESVQDLQGLLDNWPDTSGIPAPAQVFGYSIGAVVGVALAAHDERIRAVACGTLLLIEEAPDVLHQFGWNWLRGSALFFPHMRVPMTNMLDLERLLQDLPGAEFVNDDPLMVFEYPLRTLASLYSDPTGLVGLRRQLSLAIFHGESDEILPLSYSQRLVNHLEQPAELFPLTGVGHMLPWQAPCQLADKVSTWLKQLR